jgi:hypothetical protein
MLLEISSENATASVVGTGPFVQRLTTGRRSLHEQAINAADDQLDLPDVYTASVSTTSSNYTAQ